ncbi:tetratricopeptide repeat protein [Pontixanthobacter aestiaquae]|uniref:Sel1 repeat family protein n=1 Tax=Pontixanthobacter aestiaquae TaxID=1509367 RepID=A0A844ZCN7_9SPHN|nr:tetratricopeptide repeat protein [Pontixanthobacter aestiaquae]MDN3645421.1 tetratricopeptide repeat protein [Pontixanthobacter aestiaquae]MXO83579.1 hypothetical protein [Pontixanthobacter aestiaquae]
MRASKTLTSAALVALLMLSAAPVSSQQRYEASYSAEGDAKLLEQFRNDPEHQTYMAKAKAGDPYAMLKMERAAKVYLSGNLFDRMPAIEMRMKLLAGAMAKNYPEAFSRMGDMIFLDRAIPNATVRDAFGYYVQGVERGDKASIVQANKIVKDPVLCSICSKGSTGGLKLPVPKGKLLDIDEINKAGGLYLSEKEEMAKKLVAALEAAYTPENNLVSATLINIYLSGVVMPASHYYPPQNRFVLLENGVEAETKLKQIVAATPKDSWAPSLLGFYYANPKRSGIAKNPTEAVRYLDIAANAGDKGSAKTAQILGHEMVTGKLFPQDVPRAIKYLELSSDAGNADASYDLGLLNLLGKGIPKNYAKAEFYFRMAMERKHADGARALAQMFREGTANKQSNLLANEYERRARTFTKPELNCDDNNLMTVDCLVKYGSS